MIYKQISLVMFSTTLGHQGDKWVYKHVLKHTDEIIGLNNFCEKKLAIKVHNGEEDICKQIINDYDGFLILKEVGITNLSQNVHSENQEYTRYMIGNYSTSASNIYSLLPIRSKYILWLEDDCLIWPDKKELLEGYFKSAIDLLESNRNIFSVHMNGPLHQKESGLFYSTKYAFRPHLMRSEDIFNVSNCFKLNYQQFVNIHPEMAYEAIIKSIFPNSIFVEWNAKYLCHEYIGGPDKEDVKRRLKLI